MNRPRATAANCTPRLIRGSFEQALEDLLNDRFPGGSTRKRLGLEATHASCDLWLRLQTWTAAVEWIPEHDLIETLRTIKEPSEIEALARAFELAQRAYARFRRPDLSRHGGGPDGGHPGNGDAQGRRRGRRLQHDRGQRASIVPAPRRGDRPDLGRARNSS